MNQQQTYDEMKLVAEQIGLTVRVEMGDFDGGICTVKEKRVILINRRHPLAKRVHVMAKALNQAGLDDVFLKPALREAIEDELATVNVGA